MQKSKLKLPNGIIQHGMLWADPQNGAPKKLDPLKISPGMKSQSRPGGVHGYLHGQCQDDSVPEKTYTRGEVPLHSATPNPDELCAFAPHLHPVRRMGTSSARGKRTPGEGNRVLLEGSVLGDLSRLPKSDHNR